MRFKRTMGVFVGVAALLAGAAFANENIKIGDVKAESSYSPEYKKATTEQFHVWVDKEWTWHVRTYQQKATQFRGKITLQNGEFEEVKEKGEKGAEVPNLFKLSADKKTLTFDFQQKESFRTLSFKVKQVTSGPPPAAINFDLGSGEKGFGPERINIGPRAVHPAGAVFSVPARE